MDKDEYEDYLLSEIYDEYEDYLLSEIYDEYAKLYEAS